MLAAAAWIQNDSGLPQGPADRPVSTGVRGPPPPCGHCWQRQAPSQAGAISQCKGPQVKAAPAATLNTDGYTANDEAQHAPEQSVAKPAKFNKHLARLKMTCSAMPCACSTRPAAATIF